MFGGFSPASDMEAGLHDIPMEIFPWLSSMGLDVQLVVVPVTSLPLHCLDGNA